MLLSTEMRSDRRDFAVGVGVGLALAGVAVFTVEALRRVQTRRRMAHEHVLSIDGVHAPRAPELAARPAEEANAAEIPRLESEAPDVSLMSQRW